MASEIVTPAGKVKNPKKTKRYTPPKILESPPVAPVEPQEAPEQRSVSVPPLPTTIVVQEWGEFGIILRMANALFGGTFTVTWSQVQGIMAKADEIATALVKAKEAEGADQKV
jgi:hypothetical protein